MIAERLDGRVALVTGSATGIGRAIAEALAERGAAVVAHGLDDSLNAEVLHAWTERGWRAIADATDLAQADGASALLDRVGTTLGPPDILVLNASIEIPEVLGMLSVDAMAKQTMVNVIANCLLLQRAVPMMVARGWGRVVAIGSVQEERPNARHIFYAGTKAALTSMVLNLARHDAAPHVTFNVVRPGAIATDRNRETLSNPEVARSVIERIPLARLGRPNDCAATVSLLCSNAGDYLNGAVISVDGGLRL